MATSAALKRSCLEEAFDDVRNGDVRLRDALRAREKATRAAIANGSIRSIAGLGRSTLMASYGSGEVTMTEMVELWRWLVDQYGIWLHYLNFCALYGLNAWTVEQNGRPTSLPAPVAQPVTIADDRWVQLGEEFNVPEAEVVGVVVNDRTVFLWLMWHIIAATEWQPNFIWARVPSGLQTV